jgi:hypothetical protein
MITYTCITGSMTIWNWNRWPRAMGRPHGFEVVDDASTEGEDKPGGRLLGKGTCGTHGRRQVASSHRSGGSESKACVGEGVVAAQSQCAGMGPEPDAEMLRCNLSSSPSSWSVGSGSVSSTNQAAWCRAGAWRLENWTSTSATHRTARK